MVDLKSSAGLPIFLDDSAQREFTFGENLIVERVKARTATELRGVLLEEPGVPEDTSLYLMYDGIYREKDRALIKRSRLRYDLTLIFPGTIGTEYIKTAGHYHSLSRDTIHSYPELYEVLYGTLHFILQKRGKENNQIEDAVLAISERGERIVVPPDYGHVAVNPGNEPLVLANWIADECTSDYKTMREYRGGVYYEKKSNGSYRLIENRHYKKIPPLRKIKTDKERASIFNFQDIPLLYDILLERPHTLNWLLDPKDAMDRFEAYMK